MEKKRNKLVIIGNGFDLAHGFKTNYNDFIVWYLNYCIGKTMSQFNFEDLLLKTTRKTPKIMPQTLLSIKDFRKLVVGTNIEIIKISPFLSKLIDTHEEYNWVDIENEYYKSVISWYNDLVNINNYSRRNSILSSIILLNEAFEYLKNKLVEYLDSIQKGIIPFHSINTYGKINQVFKKYSQDFFKNDESKTITFLNFNYTNTIERYIGKGEDLNHEIIYIHGQLNNPDNPIIFGFGDEIDGYYKKIEEANVNDLLNNFKSFWYFKTHNYQSLLRFIDSDIFDVEILGHSCGLSDRVLLNNIFEHKKCQAIKIHYHQRETGNDFFSKTQEISRHFRDKAKMRKVIVDFSKCQSMNDA